MEPFIINPTTFELSIIPDSTNHDAFCIDFLDNVVEVYGVTVHVEVIFGDADSHHSLRVRANTEAYKWLKTNLLAFDTR